MHDVCRMPPFLAGAKASPGSASSAPARSGYGSLAAPLFQPPSQALLQLLALQVRHPGTDEAQQAQPPTRTSEGFDLKSGPCKLACTPR